MLSVLWRICLHRWPFTMKCGFHEFSLLRVRIPFTSRRKYDNRGRVLQKGFFPLSFCCHCLGVDAGKYGFSLADDNHLEDLRPRCPFSSAICGATALLLWQRHKSNSFVSSGRKQVWGSWTALFMMTGNGFNHCRLALSDNLSTFVNVA